jgi:4,5-DOPA dioxygenase extradiol
MSSAGRAVPALFVSHGAPTMILEPVPVREFLAELGGTIAQPKAILAVSAHWETGGPAVGGAASPQTIHDFYGFPEQLYRLRYGAPGAPDLARRVASALRDAGLACEIDARQGLDHGAWAPLMLMYPEARIPVTQLSVQPGLGAAHHYRLGQAVRPLREEGVLVLGSGGLTHNLGEFRGHALNDPPPEWVAQFREWAVAALEAGRDDDLIEYRSRAPHGARNHPSEEHFLPLLVAAGARSQSAPGRRIHSSTTYGVLAMDAFAFA